MIRRRSTSILLAAASAAAIFGLACAPTTPAGNETAPAAPDPSALLTRARSVFAALPAEVARSGEPIREAEITLGRMLYYEPRLSRSQTISCNSCHALDRFGVDGERTSPGHRGQRGNRNSPTVYNAGLHLAQFWDGRAATLEDQAKGPVLNPVEMAMKSEAATVAVLASIPGYRTAFRAAFPNQKNPVTYDNMAKAIGAFERRLLTPSAFDRFLQGDTRALGSAEQEGLAAFMDAGCITCHNGAAVGGGMYQKLGAVKPFETNDRGRENVTQNAADRFVFKVPSLRNIAKTAPYFHDGSIATLDEAVRLMARHQLGRELTDGQVRSIGAFLGGLTGEPPAALIAKPELPKSGPKTPRPDAS